MLQGNVSYNDNNKKYLLLPHQRNYIRTFINPRTLTENDYSNDELQALRQAVVNHEWMLKNVPDLKKRISLIQKDISKRNNNNTNILKRYHERVIDYPDYKQVYVTNDYGNKTPVNFNHVTQDQYSRIKNTKDPNFFMQGTIGAADYNIDKHGNVILNDKYNFTQDKISDRTHYKLPAILAKMFGTPYNIRINLGNINDWGLDYSGYNNILDWSDNLMRR